MRRGLRGRARARRRASVSSARSLWRRGCRWRMCCGRTASQLQARLPSVEGHGVSPHPCVKESSETALAVRHDDVCGLMVAAAHLVNRAVATAVGVGRSDGVLGAIHGLFLGRGSFLLTSNALTRRRCSCCLRGRCAWRHRGRSPSAACRQSSPAGAARGSPRRTSPARPPDTRRT